MDVEYSDIFAAVKSGIWHSIHDDVVRTSVVIETNVLRLVSTRVHFTKVLLSVLTPWCQGLSLGL